ncbi:MAG: tryptophan-rich sensory protein [Elusimicrobia bacterium]|nr:tryptophan-rich sensory protein [Candidatus Liberimonas magnetica]
MQKTFRLIGCILIAQMAGLIGSLYTTDAISSWYETLNKPSFNPPNWVFGPVWTILFTLMGIALFIIWEKEVQNIWQKRRAILVFFIQLCLNTLWSIVFFGMHSFAGAMIVIVLLWISILLNIISFYKISKYSGALLIPYILWVSFALVLNGAFVFLNK